MRHRTAAMARPRRAIAAGLWAALGLVLTLLAAPRQPIAWASNGGGVTIATPPDGIFVPGSSLTASFTTDGALTGNLPLTVSFVSSTGAAVIYSKYTILSAQDTTYTASIAIPDLVPGEYILIIEGPEINGGKLMSNPITVVAPTPTPLPSPTMTRLLGTQAHEVPPAPDVSGGVVAAAAAGLLLAVSLALLIVPPLRRRGNQPPR